MFSPLHSYIEREHMGMYTVTAPMQSGTAVDIDPTNTTPISGSIYGAIYGNIVAATCAVAGSRELGWLLQPVTATGPTIFNLITQVYDESVAQGSTAVVAMSKAGALIGTDQITTSGVNAILFDNTVALGTLCGLNAGKLEKTNGTEVNRAKFMGKVTQRNITLAMFQLL
jgi:hypothetical protein